MLKVLCWLFRSWLRSRMGGCLPDRSHGMVRLRSGLAFCIADKHLMFLVSAMKKKFEKEAMENET